MTRAVLALAVLMAGCQAQRPPGADTAAVTGRIVNATTATTAAQESTRRIGENIGRARTKAERIEYKSILLLEFKG